MASSQEPGACDFSVCLIGSLYKSYTLLDNEKEYLDFELPFDVGYSVPKGKTVQPVQRSLNSYLRKEFVSDLYLFYTKACELPEDDGILEKLNSFLKQTISEYLSGRNESTNAKFMFVNLIVTELNLYCFKQKCYRFANYLPILIDSVLKASVEELFSEINTLKNENGRLKSGSEAVLAMYEDLKKCCREIETSDGAIVRDMIPPFVLKVKKLIMPDSPEGTSEELWKLYEQSLQASGQITQVQGRCALCKEENCKKYLQQFIDDFVEKYPKSCKCPRIFACRLACVVLGGKC